MSEHDIALAKGFGYKAGEVDACIDKLLKENEDLETEIDKLKSELKELKAEKAKFDKRDEEWKQREKELAEKEAKQVRDFADLMENGKRIVGQMTEDAKQKSEEITYNSRQLMENAKIDAQKIKDRSLQDVKNISSLLAEIAKTSAKSKETVSGLYDQIDQHYQSFVAELQRISTEVLSKEE